MFSVTLVKLGSGSNLVLTFPVVFSHVVLVVDFYFALENICAVVWQ